MTLSTLSVRIAPTASGIVNSDYPTGVEPGAPLAWGPIPNFNGEADGIEQLWDVRQFLSGAAAATAPIALVGTPPAGWSVPDPQGLFLRFSGVGETSGFGKLSTTGDVLSAEFSMSSSFATGADTLAPCAPTRLTAESLPGAVKVVWDQTLDPHSGLAAGAQIARYDLYRNNNANPIASVSGFPGVTANDPFFVRDVGVLSPPGASSQDVAARRDWYLEGEGYISEGTPTGPDRFRAAGYTLSGDSIATCRVASFVGGTDAFAKAGVMARASDDTVSAMICAQIRRNGGVRVERRTSLGGQRVTTGAGTATFPCWLQLRRDGDTYTAYYAPEVNGLIDDWVLLDTQVIPSPGTLNWMIFACSTESGVPTTVHFNEVSFAPAERLSYTHSTDGSGQYTVKAVDKAGQVSSKSFAVIGAPLAAGDSKPWHPGHWVEEPLGSSLATTLATFAEINGTNFKGLMKRFWWTDIEASANTASGTYDWSAIDAMLAEAQKYGKYFGFIIKANNASQAAQCAPAYVRNVGGTNNQIYGDATTGYGLRRWDPINTDAMLVFFTAMAARYNGHPWLEFVGVAETALGKEATYNTVVPIYSAQGYANELIRFGTEANKLFTKTQVRFMDNFLTAGSSAVSADYMAKTTGVAHYGPDVMPNTPTGTPIVGANGPGKDRTLIQKTAMGLIGGGQYKPTDYRGIVPLNTNSQGWTAENYTPEQTMLEVNDNLKANYHCWLRVTWGPDPGDAPWPGKWNLVKDYVAAPNHELKNLAPPSLGKWRT